jgi:hypothetical protein
MINGEDVCPKCSKTRNIWSSHFCGWGNVGAGGNYPSINEGAPYFPYGTGIEYFNAIKANHDSIRAIARGQGANK